MVGKIVYAAISAAVSYLASYLLAPKVPKTPLDDSLTEPSVRGTILPVLLGHYRIGATMGWVGGRKVNDNSVYRERGMHMISVGLGRSMTKIFSAGEVIWEGDIKPADTPSGSYVDLGTEGRFQIFWGEDDQEICEDLADYTGVYSAYPHIFYIYWDTKRLGTSPIWPSIEYEVTVDAKALDSEGIEGDSFFEDYSYTWEDVDYYLYGIYVDGWGRGSLVRYYKVRLTGTTAYSDVEEGMRFYIEDFGYAAEITEVTYTDDYTFLSLSVALSGTYMEVSTYAGHSWTIGIGTCTIYGWTYWGASPACSIEQFIFQDKPWGANFDRSLFDDSLQTIYDLMVEEETPCTSLLKSGRSWKDGIVSIMQDMGLVMYFDQSTGLYGFRAIREVEESEITEIPYENYSPDTIEEQFAYSVLDSDTLVFTFNDSARKFATSTIRITDDASAEYGKDANAKQVALETLTAFNSASLAVARRDKETSITGVLSTEISYDTDLTVGDPITFEGLTKNYRVASVQQNPDEAKKTLGCLEDVYSVYSNYIELNSVGLNPGSRTTPAPDSLVAVIETNRYISPDTDGYYLVRIRYSDIVTLSYIYDSPDDTTYTLNDTQETATGGILTEAIDLDSSGLIDEGPEFEVYGDDIDNVLDLSSSEDSWRSGVQLCLINNELFFLKAVTAMESGTYRLDGLLRARYGTTREEHAIDDSVFIFTQTSLKVFSEPWVATGRSVYVKSVPAASTGSVSIDEVIAESIDSYSGGGSRPLQPANLTTEDWTGVWDAGEDVVLRWDYKNASSGAGAGITLSGIASEKPEPEGYFKLEIYDGTTLVRTVTSLLEGSYTYDNTDIVSDFGSEPSSITVQLVEVLNGLTSPVEEATITKV